MLELEPVNNTSQQYECEQTRADETKSIEKRRKQTCQKHAKKRQNMQSRTEPNDKLLNSWGW